MGNASDESARDRAASCKIDRVAAARGLPDAPERLATYWTRENGRYSLRELATHFNRSLLRAAMEEAGRNPLDGEVENTHRLLTDDDVSHGMRTQTRNRLQREGVDVEGLQADFVSYQTVRRHLKGCLGVERSRDDATDPAETAVQRIAALQNRTRAVTESTLSGLHAADETAASDLDVIVDITVSCANCGAHAPVREFIRNGGCRCGESAGE